MKWRTIDRETSQQCFEEFCSTRQVVCDDEYKDLRNDVLNLFNASLAEIGITEEEMSVFTAVLKKIEENIPQYVSNEGK